MSVHILGIRHHGQGSNRHVINALNELRPDIILVEGPPEGEQMLQWVVHEDMKPPVALLAYVPDNPHRAAFYPFADYSPEWNAIKYGVNHKIPVRFIDMPLIHKLAGAGRGEETDENEEDDPESETEPEETEKAIKIHRNPMAHLATIAGFDDAEEWWEQNFEIASHPSEVFEAVGEMMTALREGQPEKDLEEKIREAFMRTGIRRAQKEMYHTIAVICGAWHAPALVDMPKQKEDDALIKNLPKTKVETTWIPWTNDRLSFESGYGAGLESPGWYEHRWANDDDDGTKWLTHSARIFRNNKVDISSAHIIEAVRLANSLAGLRNLSRPGLKEFNEATQSVMCMGDGILMQIIRRELIVGKTLGQIPEGTPQVPLQRNLEQLIKKLRLKISNEEKNILLDLREDNDLQKSILLHRLQVLNVPWGRTQYTRGKGTFKEEWRLLWEPELTIALLEKAPWGNTVEIAANKYLESVAEKCTKLDEITQLVQKALPAELQEGIRAAMIRMDALAAGTSDTVTLMDAFIPLAQVSRYGNVRKTDLDTINLILDKVFYRIIAGLPYSCSGIDEEQAASITDKIKQINQSIVLLNDAELSGPWFETLGKITGTEQAAPMVKGACCKIMYDNRYFDTERTAVEFSRALSVNNPPNDAANWLEGFLKDAATVLILDENIWEVVHNWVASLDEEIFNQVIPLLRRTFAVYSSPEKQKIAYKVKQGKDAMHHHHIDTRINHERAGKVLPVLEKLLGLQPL